MNFKKGRVKEPVLIEITPLIDVVFLLLIFFMVSTTFVSAPGIKVDLPEATAQDIVRKKEDVTIVLKTNNDIIFNQVKVSFLELKQKLNQTAVTHKDTLVIIKADTTVSHGRVVEVMDAARASGLTQLAIATKPK
ncbi:MAG: biopolymer transporter ExbD [Deltaproteobacteria bacterium]|nr:biopolymer transporter ExbD [Deltaproteobacteria bacterium]